MNQILYRSGPLKVRDSDVDDASSPMLSKAHIKAPKAPYYVRAFLSFYYISVYFRQKERHSNPILYLGPRMDQSDLVVKVELHLRVCQRWKNIPII